MIELADSHGHLTMVFPGPEARWPTRAATDGEVAELVSRARDAGVTRILVPATTLDDVARADAKAIDLPFLVEEGTIAPQDLRLVSYAETAVEAWEAIARFHGVP